MAALHPVWADLSAAHTADDLGRALRAQAARDPEAPWVRGAGWDEMAAGLCPDRHALDAVGLDRPIIVTHYSLHQCVVDSRGLDALGIGRGTPDPPGGTIERAADGEPTGLLVERAWSEAHARSLAHYRDPTRWGDLIAARARVLVRDGITCVHDAACPPSAEAAYRRLAAAGALPISVLVMPHAEAILHPPPAERLDGPVTGAGDEWLRVGPVKLFADGGIAPAIDVTIGGQRAWYGVRFDDLGEHLVRAVTRGFRVAVHAMGNVGLQMTLDAFAAAARVRPDQDHRFRVEHATLASRAQLEAMRRLGAVAVVQPGFLHHMGRAVESFPLEQETGSLRRHRPHGRRARRLVRRPVRLPRASDPACGTTRRTVRAPLGPEQALDYEEWLRAYTSGAAYAGGQEHERGSITPGKRADLVIIEGRLDPAEPPRVVETWVAGARVYLAG
jgi:predicted amidohydrolase YtcJ